MTQPGSACVFAEISYVEVIQARVSPSLEWQVERKMKSGVAYSHFF